MEDTNTFLWEMMQDRPKEYAVIMYDAFGKQGSGIIEGNVNQPGMMQQCRSAHGPTFSGQYCQVFISQGMYMYFVGVCVPDSCGEKDVQNLALHGKLQLGQMSLIPPLPHILVNQSAQEVTMTHCLLNTLTPDTSDIICITVCCVMIAIPLLATLLTAIIRWKRNREVSPSEESFCSNTGLNLYGTLKTDNSHSSETNSRTLEENNSTKNTPQCFPRSCLYQGLQAFSLQTTTKGVLSTSVPGGGYASLNGIRVLSLFWIMSGHTTQIPILSSLDNINSLLNTVESNILHVFTIGGPVFLGVDTFLVLGGLLSARSLLGCIDKAKDKLTFSLVANYLFRRIKRVQPLHLFITCLATGILPLFQWEPFWFPDLENFMDCKKYWWANAVFVSNLIQVSQICIPWTWYLSLDFQCFLTTPLLLYFYRLNKGVFAAVVIGLLLVTTLSGAVLTALLQLQVTYIGHSVGNYAFQYYHKPHTRYGPFLLGILTGLYLGKRKNPFIKKKWQAALGWFFCLSLLAVLFGLSYLLVESPPYPSVPHALYQGLHRHLWALAVIWIILACEDGYGGFIKSFLSMGFWVPLSNISFACYLIHPMFIILYLALLQTPIHYTEINFLYLFLGVLMLSVILSYILTVLVEKPFVLLKWSCKRMDVRKQ
ncbi:O-acyltransferase like protein [Mastacembelus armatus]|uniref:O-acyltransferase like protein n=1 Tax=Mastacembelus armatus TaxID=205130 RepID=UPI000E45C824|nr:O-acyltransferase like protein-like [Mastacembelus armatus]